jgi:hypothetical protein
MATVAERQRRPRGQLREAMRELLEPRDEPACIKEIVEGVRDKLGIAPASSYRSALQDQRYFERVARGVFKIKKVV